MPSPINWTLYSTNEGAWTSMLADCAKAEKSIVLEQFIFAADDFGQKFIDICAEKAAKGVRVRFLWDAAGSFTFWGSNIAEDLRKKGIELLFWKTLIPGYFKVPSLRSWFLRNHRRTLVIDGKIGYTGSICVNERMKNWRDTNVRLEDIAAKQMENAFNRMWERAKGSKSLPVHSRMKGHEFRYITNYPAPGRRHINKELIEAIREAEKYIYITTPYFIPTRRLAHAIKLAARRGVNIQIILPEKSDYYAVDLGARSYFNMLLEANARIFLYQGNMIHSKTVVIDGKWATVGTMNLDNISMLYNFEANIITTNTEFAHELESHFKSDLTQSKEVLLNEWRGRFFIEKIPEILIRLVRKFL
ncbi:MAG: phospholipase D-like domain-containing protein [Patescibacteria group bacterium]